MLAARSAAERQSTGPFTNVRHGTSETQGARLAARLALASFLLVLAAGFASSPAYADIVKNPIAVFAALDKVTGRISHLEVPINKTVEFGALKVTPRVCDTRPPTEQPHTASFVEVDEVKLTGEVQRIFTGWMFAESPGLHAVEHPVFDVWLTNCKTNAPPAPSGSARTPPLPARRPKRLQLRRPPKRRPTLQRRLRRQSPRKPCPSRCHGPTRRLPTRPPAIAETRPG